MRPALGLGWVGRVGWVGWLGLAACFDPHPLPGAPCDDLAPCPRGQMCIANTCSGVEGGQVDARPGDASDARPDGTPSILDRDGDEVLDGIDNCPDTANPDQGDEDGDLVGDACDPCPIDVNNAADPDSDGVAGICDPHPDTAGDKILVFDGFHRALPSTWEVIGSGVQSGDDMVLTTIAGNHSNVVAPAEMLGNGMLMAALTVDATVGIDAAVVLSMPYDPVTDHGLFCELDAPNLGPVGRFVSLYDSLPDRFRGTRGFGWATGTQYRVTMTRNGNSYGCSFTADGGSPQNTGGSSDTVLDQAKASIGVYDANIHAAWLLLVSSP